MASASTETIDEGSDSQQNDNTNSPYSETSAVAPLATRSVYLVTYSQAHLEKFPSRNEFAKAIIASFTEGLARKHYHMALKLNKVQRWLPSKRYLSEQFGISVHYSNIHHDYYSAWQYSMLQRVMKHMQRVDGHPDLSNVHVPKTTNASIGKKNVRGKAVVKRVTKGKRGRKGEKETSNAIGCVKYNFEQKHNGRK